MIRHEIHSPTYIFEALLPSDTHFWGVVPLHDFLWCSPSCGRLSTAGTDSRNMYSKIAWVYFDASHASSCIYFRGI